MDIKLSELIRQETKNNHQALEKQVNIHLKEIVTTGDYTCMLSFFYAYFLSMETLLSPFITSGILPDIDSRRKAHLIKDDLITSGAQPDLMPVTTLPEISSPLEAMAAMYVLEGSTLGGAIIAKILERKNIISGTSFFHAYGAENKTMWTKFLTALDQMPADEKSRSAAVLAARQTFDCFHKLFASTPPAGSEASI